MRAKMKSFNEFYAEKPEYFGAEPTKSLKLFIESYRPEKGKAMDIGAGEGRNTFYLASKGYETTAVEPSAVGAREIMARMHGYEKDISVINDVYPGTELKETGFSLIVSVTSLDHMSRSDVKRAVKDIKSRLKTGGYIFIIVFTERDPGNTPEKINASDGAGQIRHYFKTGELKELFADFEIEEYFEFDTYDDSHGRPHYHSKDKLIARKI